MIMEKSNSRIKTEGISIREPILDVHSRQWMGNVLLVTDMISLFIAIVIGIRARHLSAIVFDSSYIELFLLLGITVSYLFLRQVCILL